jgi:hypothetical protein
MTALQLPAARKFPHATLHRRRAAGLLPFVLSALLAGLCLPAPAQKADVKPEPVSETDAPAGEAVAAGRGAEAAFTASATLPFYDGFESGALNGFWMTSGSALGRVLVAASNAPFSGAFHATFDTPANGTNHRAELTLSMDLTGFTNVTLKFWAREYGDEPQGPPPIPFTNSANFDGVAISTDGVLWYEVLGLRDLTATYAQRTVNLDTAVASRGLAYGPNFLIRFNQYDNFPIPTDGIAIDDVTVSGLVPGTPGIFIDDAVTLEGTGAFQLLTFTVRLSQPATNTVMVDYLIADGTATAPGDYLPVGGSLIFQPGQTNAIIVVPIVGDDLTEPDEYFRVLLTNAVGATLANGGAVGNILNDDTPVVTVSDASVAEGDAGAVNAVFTITLSKPAPANAFLSYSAFANTATAGSDFIATNGFLIFPVGATSAQFAVPVLGDLAIEPDETFFVSLAVSDNLLLPVTFATGTILDDDNVPGKLSRFRFGPLAPLQRTGAPFPVTITALDAFDNPVAGFTGPVALAGVSGFPEVVTGNGSTTFEWPLSTFYHDARLQTIYLASELGGPRQITSLGLDVTTLPGQPMNNWTIRLKHTALAAYPNNPSWDSTGWTTVFQTNLTVSAAGILVFPLTTPFNYDGTNNLIVDFSFNNTSFTTDGRVRASAVGANRSLYFRTDSGFGDPLTWAARNPAPTVGQIVPDLLINGGQPVAVPITPVTSGAFSNGQWSGQVAVLQSAERVALVASDAVRTNASAEFAVLDGSALFISGATRAEGNAPDTLNLAVSLGFPAEQPITVDYATISGTAQAGEDFTAASGTLTFNVGESSKNIPVTILGDLHPELNESFRVVLTNAVNATLFRATATVTLLNDDQYPPLSDQPRPGFWTANGNVNAVLEHNGTVYIGGAFTEVGGEEIGKLAPFARGDGALRPGFPSVDRNVTTVIDDGAGGWFVGGQFSYVGGLPRARLVHILPDLTVDPNFAPGFNNNVNALALDGTNLYVGGTFTAITNGGATLTRTRFAVLDPATGAARSLVADPGFNNTVNALAVRNGVIYVGGTFDQVTYPPDSFSFRTRFAGIDAVTGFPTTLEPEVDNTVNTIAVEGDRLFLGGTFTAVGGLPRFRIASINLPGEFVEPWEPQLSGQVFALLPTNGVLYVGGGFTSLTNAGGVTVRSNFVALDLATGAPGPLAPNPTGNVRALALDGGELFLGGDFQTIGAGLDRRRMGSLDLATGAISDFDPDVGSGVFGLTVRSNFVYAGGQFSFAKGTRRNRLAAFDAEQGGLLPWNPNANNIVWALKAAGEEVFAAGQFTTIGGQGRQRLAAINAASGAVRASFLANLNGTGRALAVWNDTLFVGGDFTAVTPAGAAQARSGVAAVSLANGAINSNFVANAIPPAGLTSNLLALIVHRDTVYVSGAFTNVGGAARNRLAAIDAATGAVTPWQPAVATNVFALAAFDTNIYLGGEFTSVTNSAGGAVTRNRLAAVSALTGNVTAWNPNANNTVAALVLGGTNLYATGNFTTLAALSRPRLAELDLFRNTTNSTAWSPDLNAAGLALAVGANGRLHAGGAFTAVNTQSRRAYALFDRSGPPVLTLAAGSLTFLEDGPPLIVDAALEIYSPADAPVVSASVALNGHVPGEDVLAIAAPPGITAGFDAATGVLTLTGSAPAADYQAALRSVAYQNTSGAPTGGARNIVFTASNTTGASAPVSRTVQVVSVNDAPSFTKGPDVTVAEDSGAANLAGWATNISSGAGEAGQTVEFLVSNNNAALFAAAPSISPSGALKFTPAPDAFGIATVTATLKDNGGTANGGVDTSAPQTFLLTVTAVNDPPVAQPRSLTLTEDTAATVTLAGFDPEGDPLSFLMVAPPANGALSGTPPAVTYTPAANYHGPDSFTFKVSDGLAESAAALVSLTILPVNDAPVADASATVSPVIAPNNVEAWVVLDGSRSSDAENDPLTYLWFLAGTTNYLGSGVIASNHLAVGANLVELIVSDGQAQATNVVEVVVKSPGGAIGDIIKVIEQSGLSRNARPLLASLEAAIASFNRNNFTSGVNQLRAFQNKLAAQVQPGDPLLAAKLNQMAQEIIDVVTAPPVP